MSTRALLSFVAVAAMLGGCASKGAPVLDQAPVLGATQIKCTSSASVCHIKVTSTSAVQFEEIHLARGVKDIQLVWDLPEGYVFCKQVASDGGVALKASNDGQFNDMYSTDDPEGANPPDKDCKKHRRFHWNAKNSLPRPAIGYGYNVYFYDQAGVGPFRIDPWIFND